MTNVYSEEARTAARELRARLKRDLAAGLFVSSSTASASPPHHRDGEQAHHGRRDGHPEELTLASWLL